MPRDTGILDEFFGPRPFESATEARKQLYSWRCEEAVSHLLNHFCEETDYEQPKDLVTRRSWVAGMRRWFNQFGEDYELMDKVIRYMDGKNLWISSPHSLINTGMAMKRKRKEEEDTEKYLRWLE